jgi:hypothetical protein
LRQFWFTDVTYLDIAPRHFWTSKNWN